MEQSKYQVAEINVSYTPKQPTSQRIKICQSRDAYHLLRSTWDENKLCLLEEFKVIFLNRAHHVLGISTISQGGIAGTMADPKVILGMALKTASSGLILAHNHPSGNLNPSQADNNLTHKLCQGSKYLDISIADHLIITDESYYSFADNGLMP